MIKHEAKQNNLPHSFPLLLIQFTQNMPHVFFHLMIILIKGSLTNNKHKIVFCRKTLQIKPTDFL